MYADSRELVKFRQELVNGGFTPEEAFELISAYFEAKLDTRIVDDGTVYLINEQVDLGDGGDG